MYMLPLVVESSLPVYCKKNYYKLLCPQKVYLQNYKSLLGHHLGSWKTEAFAKIKALLLAEDDLLNFPWYCKKMSTNESYYQLDSVIT